MPPKPRSQEGIQRDKQRIIDAALDIVHEKGLEKLSIRKLSARLDMSATNIYNYFYNKDEIYLHILINGFEKIQEFHREALEGVEAPAEQLEIYLRCLCRFWKEYPAYYQLMFSTEDPKCMDYIGTPIEELAKQEKENAMESYYLLRDIISRCSPELGEKALDITTVRIVSEIHGFINLCHNNIMRELGADPYVIIDDLLEHIISPLCGFEYKCTDSRTGQY